MTTYKVHSFTTSTNFVVSSIIGNPVYDTVDYLVVAGGGGGGPGRGGGGGAGGFRTGNLTITSTGEYAITVGGGGTISGNGNPSVFYTITSAGGGSGGPGGVGGSPGGSGGGAGFTKQGGSGNVPPTSPPQGNPGGATPGGMVGTYDGSSGGGGAGAAGQSTGPVPVGRGGAGANSSITGSVVTYAGGGSAGSSNPGPGPVPGGDGGGGAGGKSNSIPGTQGTNHLGGGGGGGGFNVNNNTPSPGAAGGSGIVIIRYPIIDFAQFIQSKVSRVSNIVANTSTVTTGEILEFTVSTVNAANGEVLYYSTNNQPNAAFTSGNTGSFEINGNVGYVTLSITSSANSAIDGNYLDLQVRRKSSEGPILAEGGNVYSDIPL